MEFTELLKISPPIIAILIAVVFRNVYSALLAALLISETLIAQMNPGAGLLGLVERIVGVFGSEGNTRILLFCLLIGALIAFMRDSGGVAAMARAMINSGLAKTKRRAELSVALTGCMIFVETNMSLLSSGVLGRKLFDTYKLSRERLAYIIDSTSAPISVILLFNGWGAYALSLVEPYDVGSASAVVIGSVGWNFYALLTIAGVFLTVATGKVFGPMKEADSKADTFEYEDEPEPTKPIYMWLPLLVMVASAIGFMIWTGEGDIRKGSGSQSIMWAVSIAFILAIILLWIDKVYSIGELQQKAFDGIGEMIPMVTVLLLSIALGASLRALGTGDILASIAAGNLPPMTVPVILFAAAGVTSFMTGTSWGTYGILIPIAMPLAIALGIPPSLALAAVLGGGVFGDHCSPISDTTLIASLASGTDHLSHVKTQLPYALLAALFASLLYLGAGALVTAQS